MPRETLSLRQTRLIKQTRLRKQTVDSNFSKASVWTTPASREDTKLWSVLFKHKIYSVLLIHQHYINDSSVISVLGRRQVARQLLTVHATLPRHVTHKAFAPILCYMHLGVPTEHVPVDAYCTPCPGGPGLPSPCCTCEYTYQQFEKSSEGSWQMGRA